jgi:hypothetical protein
MIGVRIPSSPGLRVERRNVDVIELPLYWRGFP